MKAGWDSRKSEDHDGSKGGRENGNVKRAETE